VSTIELPDWIREEEIMPKNEFKLERIAPGEWRFNFPAKESVLMGRVMDGAYRIDQGDLLEAERILRSVLGECPGHLEASHYLATALWTQDRQREAVSLWCEAVVRGMEVFPPGFVIGEDCLAWARPENRPFLGAYAGLGRALQRMGMVEEAFGIFQHLLAFNPNDDQQIRSIALETGFALKRPAEVLPICNLFAEDPLVDTVYARALALFQTGKKKQAKKAMVLAIGAYPLVARELIRKSHPRLRTGTPDFIDATGRDGAYWYWRRMGRYWKETEGALQLLEECLNE